jgi:hypothetical protein
MCVQGWTRLVHRKKKDGFHSDNSETTTITTNEFRSYCSTSCGDPETIIHFFASRVRLIPPFRLASGRERYVVHCGGLRAAPQA